MAALISNLKPNRRWFRFSLRAMLVVVTLCSIALAVWKHYHDRWMKLERLLATCEESVGDIGWSKFHLKLEQSFIHSDGQKYRLLVFDSSFRRWPGSNPYKLVVADNSYELMSFRVCGGQEMLISSVLTTQGKTTTLKATCLHRPMWGGVGTYTYLISPTEITPVGGVVWDDPYYWDTFIVEEPRASLRP